VITSPAGEVANSAVSMILYALGIDSTVWICNSAAKLQYVPPGEDMVMEIEGEIVWVEILGVEIFIEGGYAQGGWRFLDTP
jgi:hypothetical protein